MAEQPDRGKVTTINEEEDHVIDLTAKRLPARPARCSPPTSLAGKGSSHAAATLRERDHAVPELGHQRRRRPRRRGAHEGLRKRMGGRRSGRRAGRATTDDGLWLSLSNSRAIGCFGLDARGGGSLVWTNTTAGDRVGSIGYKADLGQDSSRVRPKYTSTRWDGEHRELEYWIQLENNTSTLWRPRQVRDAQMSTDPVDFVHRLHCAASLKSSIARMGAWSCS